MKRVILLLFVAASAWAQSVVTVNEAPLPVVTGVSATYQNGTKGATTYWYWVIAKFAIGNASPSNPFAVASITSGVGTVAVTWQTPPISLPNYALTYVVLRTASNQFPNNGTCSNCLVSGAVTGTSVTDSLGSLASYTLVTYVSPKSYNISVDNTTTDIARLNATGSNGTPIIPLGMNSGTVIPSYCNPGEQFFKTNTIAGPDSYVCSYTNTYTQINTSHLFSATFATQPQGTTIYLPPSLFAGAIKSWRITVDAGQVAVDIWKHAIGAFPTIVDSITASAVPSLSSGTTASGSSLTGWITNVVVGDMVAFNLQSISGASIVNIEVIYGN